MYLTGLYQAIDSSGFGESIKSVKYEMAAPYIYLPVNAQIKHNGAFLNVIFTQFGLHPINA
jgi:hypothetical protein